MYTRERVAQHVAPLPVSILSIVNSRRLMRGLVNVIPFATDTEAFFLGELAGRKFESHPKHGLFLSFFIIFLLSPFFFPR